MLAALSRTAYGSGQTRFPLILANGSEAEASVAAAPGSLPLRLRFGSTGEPVRAVQSALVRLGLLRKADIDGDCGRLTVLARGPRSGGSVLFRMRPAG
ncbi:MAG: hypothetical protein NZ523_05125 [Elioraea sp.]|nr:hypothetical protein [Elioraea sp.]